MDTAIKEKIDQLLAEAWQRRKEKAALALSLEAQQLSESLGYPEGVAYSKLCMGSCYSYLEQQDRALEYLLEVLPWYEAHPDPEKLIELLSRIGRTYFYQGKYLLTLDYYTKGYRMAKGISHPMAAAQTLNMGIILMELNRLDEAIVYYKEAAELLGPESELYVFVLANMSECYYKLGNYNECEQYAQKALSHSIQSGDLGIQSYALSFIGMSYSIRGEYDKAIVYLSQAFEINPDEFYEKSRILLELGRIYIALDRLDKATECLSDALDMGNRIDAGKLLRDIHLELSNLYERTGSFEKALIHHKKYAEFDRQLNEAESNQRIDQFQIQMQLDALKDITAMGEIGQELTSFLDFSQLPGKIYQHVQTLMDADIFGIGFYNEATKIIDYTFFIESGSPLPAFQTHLDDPESLAADCIRQREAIIKNNLDTNVDATTVIKTGKGRIPMSVIYCPLIVAGCIIGVVTVQSYSANAYRERQIRLIKALASYIAIALNNSQQSDKLRNALIHLQEANEELQKKHSEAESQKQILDFYANNDPLTGIPNRRAGLSYLEKLLELSKMNQSHLSIVFIDIDELKHTNDTYGHAAGDQLIMYVTEKISAEMRATDMLFRLGGDEFLLVLPGCDINQAETLFSRLREKIVSENPGYLFEVSLSAGFEEYSAKVNANMTVDEFISRADKKMYKEKMRKRRSKS